MIESYRMPDGDDEKVGGSNFSGKKEMPKPGEKIEEQLNAKVKSDAEGELADKISGNLESEMANLKLSCLKTNDVLHKKYENAIKEHPEYQKYFQFYKYNGKDFLIVPVYDASENSLIMNTVEVGKDGDSLKIISDPYWHPNHPYTRETNVISVPLEDKTQDYGYHRVSMNKWTGEITDVDPSEYSMDEKGINGLMDMIGENAGKKFSDCSEGMQSKVKDIISNEGELKQKSHGFDKQKKDLIHNIIKGDFSGAVSCIISLVKIFFGMKESGKVTNIGKGLEDYAGDEGDFEYLESAINTVLDPEQRSKLTYLLSKIKDELMKKSLKEKGVENPSQFDLLLQQLKPGQVMLTNGLNESEGKGTMFDGSIQTVSGSRWCHSLIIEDVIEENGVIVDANIIQSTYKLGVQRTRLKEYVQGRFSSADFLVVDLNLSDSGKRDFVNYANEKEGQPYDPVSVVTDTIFGMDFDKGFSPEKGNGNFMDNIKGNLLGNNKAYCSELIFDAMEKSGLKMPQPHVSPSDLLMTDEVIPKYACYCESL